MADNRQFADHVELGGANVYFKEEPTTDTTMPNTSYFKTEDVDGKPVKISRDNIMGIVKECLGTILNGGSDQTTVTKVPTLNGNTLGASTVSTLASVLGVGVGDKHWHYLHIMTGSTPIEVDLTEVAIQHGMDCQGLWIFGYGGKSSNPGRQSLYFYNSESNVWQRVSPPSQEEESNITITAVRTGVLSLTFANEWMWFGFRKL